MDRTPNHVWKKTDATLEMSQLLTVARSMIVARKALAEALPIEIHHDPALDVLLNLFVAYAEGGLYTNENIVSVTTVHAGGVHRWVNVLVGYEFVERVDGNVELTSLGITTLKNMLHSVSKSQWQFAEV